MLKINIKKLPKSELEIEGEVEIDAFEAYFSKALKKIGEKLELPGFRKGKVPENVLLSNIPEAQILGEMAEMALSEYYPKILEKEKIDAIGHPQISITKLARKNPLGFKIKTAIMPEMQIPDYKQIAKKVLSEMKDEEKNVNVTEKEVEDTIMDIRKSRAPKIHIKEGVELTEKDSQPATLTEELPEFNDTFVQALGPFKDIKDFKEKLKENIKLEKENQAKEKTRLKIIEKIIDEIEKQLPPVKSFFISGGAEQSAFFDYARTIARRAERRVVALSESENNKVAPEVLVYLNRLSSILYALARISNVKSGLEEKGPSYK